MNMINVNFSVLKRTNPDVVGWLKVNGTNINYPFVQSKDNKYYLTHSFYKSYNAAGWIFLNYRNNNTNNYVIKVSTETENSLWQIFSVYHIPTTSDYLQTDFNSDTEYQNFLDILKNRSGHNSNTNVSDTDNILTLSTCYSNREKMVVHAKLIKRAKK